MKLRSLFAQYTFAHNYIIMSRETDVKMKESVNLYHKRWASLGNW
jgi:hypothetical protein